MAFLQSTLPKTIHIITCRVYISTVHICGIDIVWQTSVGLIVYIRHSFILISFLLSRFKMKSCLVFLKGEGCVVLQNEISGSRYTSFSDSKKSWW